MCAASLAPAGAPFIRAWQGAQGLVPERVDCITQSAEGCLWLATPGGLMRFDGREFRTVRPFGADTNLLRQILADASGTL